MGEVFVAITDYTEVYGNLPLEMGMLIQTHMSDVRHEDRNLSLSLSLSSNRQQFAEVLLGGSLQT